VIREWFSRLVTWILLTITGQKWGLRAVLMPVIVRQLGPFSALKWAATNIPKYEKAAEEMGMMRGNLAFTIASLLNGCAYCVYAHGRAFELYYFEKHGKLFPLSDHELLNLIPLTDDAVKAQLEDALVEADIGEEVKIFHRLFELKFEGAEPKTREDEHLVHAIGMYDFLNYCAIQSQAALDDIHDKINKDQDLKTRYAEARLDAGRKPMRAEDVIAIEEQGRPPTDVEPPAP
jgi:hypothetical protein